MKNIYFISESIPHKGFGSFIIFYRHLKRLKDKGYSIFLIIPDYKHLEGDRLFDDIIEEFNIVKIPFTQRLILPYRFNISVLREFRFRMLRKYIAETLTNHKPDFIISYFHSQYLNGFAAYLSRTLKCRMGLFLHDDKYLLTSTAESKFLKYDQWLYKRASVIWTVSRQLKIPGTAESKYLVLPPIPEGSNSGPVKWKSSFESPVIGFSGTIYGPYYHLFRFLAGLLKEVNGKIIILSKYIDDLKKEFDEFPNIEILPAFDRNTEALDFLRNNCSALYCGYPGDLTEMPWVISSFPSKFIEYSHIGLPIILSSDKKTALAEWAKTNQWELYTESFEEAEFRAILQKIGMKESWERNVQQVEMVASTEFNPDHIQKLFERDVLR